MSTCKLDFKTLASQLIMLKNLLGIWMQSLGILFLELHASFMCVCAPCVGALLHHTLVSE